MLRKMPFLLLVLMVVVASIASIMPPTLQMGLYALSLTLKSFILFLLPAIIFGLLFCAVVNLARQASKWIIFIFAAVCVSNFFSTWLSHFIGKAVYQFDLTLVVPKGVQDLLPLWSVELPRLISNDKIMIIALLSGFLISRFSPNSALKISSTLQLLVSRLLSLITLLIPFFIVGFIVKLSVDGTLMLIVKDYAFIFAIIGVSLIAYIGIVYWLMNGFSFKKGQQSLQNMFPAALTGFSTMSSAAAMPFTLIGTQKNATDSQLAQSVIPATVNIHLVGDCFAIPILAFAILKSFGLAEPTMIDYAFFSFYFVLAKFSVAAVPGGGIIVMLPILERYLGLNTPMLSLITALYILFDPVITCANVLGNGGLALGIDKLKSLLSVQRLRHNL